MRRGALRRPPALWAQVVDRPLPTPLFSLCVEGFTPLPPPLGLNWGGREVSEVRFGARRPQGGPRRSRIAPMMAQDSRRLFNIASAPNAPRASQGPHPQEANIAPTPVENNSFWQSRIFASDGLLRLQDGPKMDQESPGPQDGPKRPPRGPKQRPERAPICYFSASHG